jgi:hypothetical protein
MKSIMLYIKHAGKSYKTHGWIDGWMDIVKAALWIA